MLAPSSPLDAELDELGVDEDEGAEDDELEDCAGADEVPLELTGPFIAAVNDVTVVVTVVVVLFTTVIPLAELCPGFPLSLGFWKLPSSP